jgi:threonylcarbamoyladenosine tRNA methylthiotransferase MtaB
VRPSRCASPDSDGVAGPVTRVHFHTFGCKANQYDTERMRQEAEARGARAVAEPDDADVFVVNTCTVTNQADADARRYVRRLHREHPDARIVVAGCSAALRAPAFREMLGVSGVVEGHDPVAVARELGEDAVQPDVQPTTVQISLGRAERSPDADVLRSGLLTRRDGATRGWLKVQDGCDRQCGFCATRLARGASRSREPEQVLAEAALLARTHPELVITGIHIGHYGRDLASRSSLSKLLALLLDAVPDVRFRLGSVEATEVDDLLLELLATSEGRVAPHLHMPLQSGADPVLKRMRRWHTREGYRRRALEIAARLPVLGLGADVITGFPGETDADHADTAALVGELPYTYLHVFPFSPRDGTHAAGLHRTDPVPQRVAAERSQELRARVQRKAEAYHAARAGGAARVALEGAEETGLTEDYLRVRVLAGGTRDRSRLHAGVLESREGHLYIELSRERSDCPAAACELRLEPGGGSSMESPRGPTRLAADAEEGVADVAHGRALKPSVGRK